VIKTIYGETLGGKLGDEAAKNISDKDIAPWATDPFGTASGKAADGIAAWIDNESEPVPSGGAKK
jgi:hypothetical protein